MPLPSIIYGSLGGPINQDSLSRIFGNLNGATQGGVKVIHLMIQSTGGTVGDGIALHNFFRAFPIEMHAYNGGMVASIAVLSYLGISRRYVSAYASFMIHKTYTAPQGAPLTASKLKTMTKSLEIDDARTEAILKANTNIPTHLWALHASQDVHFTAQEAVQYGIAHSVKEFQVPAGSQIFQV